MSKQDAARAASAAEKDELPEGFTLALALVDAVPVALFERAFQLGRAMRERLRPSRSSRRPFASKVARRKQKIRYWESKPAS